MIRRAKEGGDDCFFFRTFEVENVPRKLDDGDLESETDSEVRDLFLSCPFRRGDHSLGTPQSESTWNEDSVRGADGLPRGVELLRTFLLSFRFEVGRFDPSDFEFATALERGVFERFDDRGVGILQRRVLSDEADRNFVE
jgi:hypothetical protein